ncbi:permease DsdX, partial [Paenibacillus sp. 28ISP30-2]|nr:permease DsdX [Paenibacillus sp. 28ISP30-2]
MNTLFGLSHNASLLTWALITIILLILLIAKFKWNPFVSLLLSSVFLGLVNGMPGHE